MNWIHTATGIVRDSHPVPFSSAMPNGKADTLYELFCCKKSITQEILLVKYLFFVKTIEFSDGICYNIYAYCIKCTINEIKNLTIYPNGMDFRADNILRRA